MKTTRRGLLKVTAAGAGAAVAAGVLGRERALAAYGKVPNLAGKTAVVVGSGFGGAVAAYRLGQAGVRTTVLERGRRWDVDGSGRTFCTIANPDWRCAWFDDRPPLGLDVTKKIDRRAGLIAKHKGDGITVLSGAAVGGGSLVIGMFLPQPRRGEWDKVYPAGLGQRLSREIRGARFELLDTGHAPQEEHPAEVAAILRRFLDDEEPRRIRTPTPRRGGSEGG